jgi:hypothetical protein
MTLIAGGFAKHLRKHPIPDDEIHAWISHLARILNGVLDPATLDETPEAVNA